ncbi:DUF7691 family protein [Streptomyces rubiginosohelvolus]|uniref:DUF7691 family protein n=1 Tax=Streptomyces rubiginosohelvolus TaxID=67362 RepID=UPI0035DB984E
MSKIVNYSMASRGKVAQFVTGRNLTADDRETLEQVRELARMHQADLERQELDRDLTVPDALVHPAVRARGLPRRMSGKRVLQQPDHPLHRAGQGA